MPSIKDRLASDSLGLVDFADGIIIIVDSVLCLPHRQVEFLHKFWGPNEYDFWASADTY